MVRICDKRILRKLMQTGKVRKTDREVVQKYLSSPTKITTNSISDVFCTLPPSKPADTLYSRLAKIYGRYSNGGMLVYELGFSHFGRQYRLDMALPDHFLGIELDGWEFHGKHL
jgi:hypothetical protein